MGESRTISGDDSSSPHDAPLTGTMSISRRPNGLRFSLAWYVGRLKLLTGIMSLGAASAILAISVRGRTDNRNSEVSLRLVPLMFAALSLFFLTGRGQKPAGRSQPDLEKVRTG